MLGSGRLGWGVTGTARVWGRSWGGGLPGGVWVTGGVRGQCWGGPGHCWGSRARGWVPQPGWVGCGGTGRGGCAWDGVGVPGRGAGVGQRRFGRRGSSLEGGLGPRVLTRLGQAGVRARGLLPCPTIPPHSPRPSGVPTRGLARGAAALCFLQKKEKSSLCLLLSSFLNIYIRGACGEQK